MNIFIISIENIKQLWILFFIKLGFRRFFFSWNSTLFIIIYSILTGFFFSINLQFHFDLHLLLKFLLSLQNKKISILKKLNARKCMKLWISFPPLFSDSSDIIRRKSNRDSKFTYKMWNNRQNETWSYYDNSKFILDQVSWWQLFHILYVNFESLLLFLLIISNEWLKSGGN
jgi:hypothetical protein